ncbi:MAG TPA: pseudouridine synthase [Pseudomonadales bacterium]
MKKAGPKARDSAAATERRTDLSTEKLHKVMADAGLGSRREMERWIEAGRVTVGGTVASLGARVGAEDQIVVDGVPLHHRAEITARILIMNKADGVICTRRDPEGRPTCFDGLPRLAGARWVSVGRLDINSSGLLLLTNDGALAHTLMHPSTGLDREYVVRVGGAIDEDSERQLREGVAIDGSIARFTDISRQSGTGYNHWYHVTLMEGRNREVRRLLESQGVQVSRLKRVRYGPVVLPASLKRGHWQEMLAVDVGELYRVLGLPRPRLPSQTARPRREAESVLIPYPELRRVTP